MKASQIYYGLTDKRRRRCEMKASGVNVIDIAKAEGCDRSAVYTAIAGSRKIIQANIKKPPTPSPYTFFGLSPTEQRRCEMKIKGMTMLEISRLDGCGITSIHNTIRSSLKKIRKFM